MTKRQYAAIALVSGLLLHGFWLETAQARAALPIAKFPTASAAITQWQRDRNILLTEAAKQRLAADFVIAARETAQEYQVDPVEIDSGAAAPIYDFLDRQSAPGDKSATLKALLAANYSSRGLFGTPEPKAYGRIRVNYVRKVDRLQIANERVDAVPLVLAAVGTVRIAGLRGTAVVCRASVEVKRTAEALFTC